MLPIKQYFDVKKEDKTAEWANEIIRYIRLSWNPLVSFDVAQLGMSYLHSYQNMDFIKELFRDTSRINLTNETGNNGGRGGLVNNMGRPVQSNNRTEDLIKREMANVGFKALPIWEKLRNVIVAEMKKMGPVVNVRSTDPTSVSKRLIDKGLIEHKDEIEGLLSYVYTSIGQAPYKLKDHKARFGEKPDNGNVEQFEAMGLNPG